MRRGRMFVTLRRIFVVVMGPYTLTRVKRIKLDWKFWESVFRIRALPRDIRACTKIVPEEFELALQKNVQTIFSEVSVLWRHDVLKWFSWFLEKKEIFKWKERCSVIVTVKCCLIVVQSCADIAPTSSKGKNEQDESALFSRHERENTCTYFHVSLVFLSNFLIRELQTVWQVQRCWMCIFSI